VQVLKLCQRAGLRTVGHVSLDGSKVQANASKHKAMSYGRMNEEEKRLAAEIEALLFRADETDRREDEQYGRDGRADDLPEEFQRRDGRLRRIREAKAACIEPRQGSPTAEPKAALAPARSRVVRSTIRRRRSGEGLQHSVLEGCRLAPT
jgi:hypothetical protein